MSVNLSPQTLGSEDPEARAFSEAVRQLWEVHLAGLKRLQGENERLQAKIATLEGYADMRQRPDNVPAVDDVPAVDHVPVVDDVPVVQSFASTSYQGPAKQASRTAWMPVVSTHTPIRKSGLFEPVVEMPRNFWFTATRIIKHPLFDIAVAWVIFLNAIVMAVEAQWQGLSVGASLNFGSVKAHHATSWASAEQTFLWIGFVFGLLYSAELILKLIGQRGSFFRPERSGSLRVFVLRGRFLRSLLP